MGARRLSRRFLDELYARHHRLANLDPDPLVFVRRYSDPLDAEVAGLVAASLAYGQVPKIMETLEGVFAVLGRSPRQALERMTPRDLLGGFEHFEYRFHKATDLALFLSLVRQSLERRGALSALFSAGDSRGDIGPTLSAFVDELLSGDPRPFLPTRDIPPAHPVRHFLPSPRKGGAAKRICLYLRWMIRKDEIDPGCWHGLVAPERLVIPLDTHVARVSRDLGLTGRKTADWKTALEVTDALRRYDPKDPVRYDFSLFRFGMERTR